MSEASEAGQMQDSSRAPCPENTKNTIKTVTQKRRDESGKE